MPLLSVVIPVFNRADLVMRAIKSALCQSVEPDEIIVVDDGSTIPLSDNLAGCGKTVVLIRLPRHLGQNAARNAGIKLSCGEFIAFLDSDDEWLSQKIEAQLRALCQAERYVFSGTQFYEVEPTRTTVSDLQPNGHILGNLLERNVVGGFSSLLIRRSALDAIGGLDETLEASADWDTAIRLAMHGEYAAVNEPLYRYYLHGLNIRNNPEVLWRGRLCFFKKHHHLMDTQIREFYRQSLVTAGVMYGFDVDV